MFDTKEYYKKENKELKQRCFSYVMTIARLEKEVKGLRQALKFLGQKND